MNQLIPTTAQRKIKALKKRIRIVQGGTSASKTFTIIPFLITYACNNSNILISIVSETIPHLRRGAIRDFLRIMEMTGNFKADRWNKSTLTYTFASKSKIEFFSADSPDKLRGARRDVLFINEANNIEFESYHQLAIRTNKVIYLDFNPTNEFWAHTELMGDDDSDFVKLTFHDNEALEPSVKNEILKAKEKAKTSTYWDNWWKVYGLGEVGSLEGVVFSNWKQCDEVPNEATYLGTGLDFGYTNDPTAIVDLYKHNNTLIYDEVIYQTGLTNSEIAKIVKNEVNRHVVADSAEPKSIEEIRRFGVNIKGATKGKDSINFGIDIMQRDRFLVTKRSVNVITELRKYQWDKDKQGNAMNKPIDYFNHTIDAMRYITTEKLNRPNYGQYVVS